MPGRERTEHLEALVAAIAARPEGAVLADLPAVVAHRTTQRYLAHLVATGRIEAIGHGRARRYRAVAAQAIGDADWRTPAAVEIERMVRRPLGERVPVGYRRELLDAYRPNVDAYAPQQLRERLLSLGRSPAGERPAGTFARQVLGRLLIDLSWASSRLEGNTYSRLDTQNLIEFGRAAEGKDYRETQMILNHKAAIELLVDDTAQVAFNRYTLQNLHAILADGLLSDPGAAGRLRHIPVGITGSVYHPTAIPQVIEEAFDQLLDKARAVVDPFEQALFVMVHLPYLQPFEDVNKRVSRLAANIPLIQRDLAPLSFVDVPERAYIEALLGVYELGRVELLRDLFAWAYERSCARYTVIRDALPAPDPLRLRYRAELSEIVRETVRASDAIEPARLRARARDVVASADLDAIVAMAMNELFQLHDGNIARFGLRLSEFRAWRIRRERG